MQFSFALYEIYLPVDGISVGEEANVHIINADSQKPYIVSVALTLPNKGYGCTGKELSAEEFTKLKAEGARVVETNARPEVFSEIMKKTPAGGKFFIGSDLCVVSEGNQTKEVTTDNMGVLHFTPKYPGVGKISIPYNKVQRVNPYLSRDLGQGEDSVSFTIIAEPACRVFLFAPFLKLDRQPFWELVVLSLLLGIAATIVMGRYWSKKSRILALLLYGLAPLLVGFLSTICASFSFIIPFEILGIIILALLTNQRRIIQGSVLTDNKRGKRRTETT